MHSICCVLEWENAEGLERHQVRRFLDELGQRLSDASAKKGFSISLLIVFDEDVRVENVRADIASSISLANSGIKTNLLFAPSTSYYDKKGLAAFFSDDDFLIFADGDCRYVPEWFTALLDPLVQGQASVTAGVTLALPAETLVEDASTLAWFFPHKAPQDRLHTKAKKRFFGNNFAAKRSALVNVPLPRFDASRAHSAEWRKRLEMAGLDVLQCGDAVAWHKQYDSISDLLKRAAILGRDKDFGVAQNTKFRAKRLMRAFAAILELNVKFLTRFCSVGLRNIAPLRWLPTLAIGLAFQWVTALTQFGSGLTTTFEPEKTDYQDLIDQAQLIEGDF